MTANYNFPRYTYSDYVNWKEDWELVAGYPLQLLPSASRKHSKIQGQLIAQAVISLKNKKENCNCEVFPELDWKISEDTIVRPDIMIICGEPTEDYLNFPPVLIIEVLSPNNIKTDRVLKFDLYRENGVKYYIMVDCQRDNVEVYELIDNYYKQVEKQNFKISNDCSIDFDFVNLWL